MNAESPSSRRPRMDGWVAAIHQTELNDRPLGSGFLIDAYRVLTCAHVVFSQNEPRSPLWVAFPKTDDPAPRRIKVQRVVTPSLDSDERNVKDVAVLILEEPVPGESAAPLRRPKPGDLIGDPWWSFGFSDGLLGDSSDGRVGESIGYGWVRLDTDRRLLGPGDSGAALWSSDHQAVVGMVGQARANDDKARALTIWAIAEWLPDEKLQLLTDWALEDAGDEALSEWGWALTRDPEAAKHWRPRARGVSTDAERGFRFRGRKAALKAIIDWITRIGDHRQVLVVTGSPGVGKSAVLGRIVTTADKRIRETLPPGDDAVQSPDGSVACAVHARGKTALDVAREVAFAASSVLPDNLDELPLLMRNALSERPMAAFAIVIDALDEAATPGDARSIMRSIAIPLAETCADLGVTVVIGSRRVDDDGDLIGPFGGAVETLDLDSPKYFTQEDLVAYTRATLQLNGDERSDNPYNVPLVAEAVAERIAVIAGGNFLVAGLVARSHGMHDSTAIDPESISFTPTVNAALGAYLAYLPSLDGIAAGDVLTALAYAESPGMTLDLWCIAVGALAGRTPAVSDLRAFARASAANFLIESSNDSAAGAGVFRLFHQALNDALVGNRAAAESTTADERGIALAFMQAGGDAGWKDAPEYLLHALPDHAVRGGVINELLDDDSYPLYADLRRLVLAAKASTSAAGRARSRLLGLTPQALDAAPEDRVALFSITETRELLGRTYRDPGLCAPYRAVWAVGPTHLEETVLEGHGGWVNAMCVVPIEGRAVLASAANDGTIRLWDVGTGDQLRVLDSRNGSVQALCAVEIEGRTLLATAGSDPVVRLRDPDTGGAYPRALEGHTGPVSAVLALQTPSRTLLVTAGIDSTVRLWDLESGESLHVIEEHSGWVNAACAIFVGGRTFFATAGNDSVVRLWDPESGVECGTFSGHVGPVLAVCTVEMSGRTLLVTAGNDSTVRLWDLECCELVSVIEGHDGWVNAACAVSVGGRPLVVTAGDDSMVRVWDPATGSATGTFDGHTGRVLAACAVSVQSRPLVVTAGDDSMVRVWDPTTGSAPEAFEGDIGRVSALCALLIGDRSLVVTAGHGVQLWDPESGVMQRSLQIQTDRIRALSTFSIEGCEFLAIAGDRDIYIQDAGISGVRNSFNGHPDGINALCAVSISNRSLLAAAGDDRIVRLWDPEDGKLVQTFNSETGSVDAVCTLSMGGRTLLAAAGERLVQDGGGTVIRLWDLSSGDLRWTFEGHTKAVSAICSVPLDERTLLASAGDDRTIRLWDPESGAAVSVHRGHSSRVNAIRAITVGEKTLLVTAGDDHTIRFWDPWVASAVRVIPVRSPALSIEEVGGLVVVGLNDGVMTLAITPEALSSVPAWHRPPRDLASELERRNL